METVKRFTLVEGEDAEVLDRKFTTVPDQTPASKTKTSAINN